MKNPFKIAASAFVALSFLLSPIWAAGQQVARPGTLNYVEGHASLGSQPLNDSSIGKIVVDPGQTLMTENGKAELLLTPGVFVRLGESSALTMISLGLTNTRVSLDRGEAFVEVDEIHPENDLRILQDGITTQLVKMGLYDFSANLHVVRVLDGEAIVDTGERDVKVTSGHMVDLTTEPLKVRKFDKEEIEAEDLYSWTSLRSGYLADANADSAPTYSYGGFGWSGDGWYWDPWFDAYTFLPGDGIFYSPFGWGFYSPWCILGAPFFWGSHYYHHFSPTSYGAWGTEAHYGLPTNYGHGVHYAARFIPHGSFGGSRVAGFHGGGFHGSRGFHGFSGGGFHGGGGFSGGGHR